jgi:hypothetical protein
VIKIKKLTCVILGLAFLALGFLGITSWVPMFQSNPIVNVCEIVLGILGFAVGVYAPQGAVNKEQTAALAHQKEDIKTQQVELDKQRSDINQQRKELDEQRKDIDQQIKQTITV